MKIGLVDIDGFGKKKKWGGTVYPNLALCKIARWHRQQGDDVEWAVPMLHYDRVYMSKVFNFSPDDRTIYDADEIIRGGTGYDIESHLPEEIDRLQPDYSIYPQIPKDTAYGFLTRGCPNKCPWCVVPRKEGKIRPYMDVDEIAIEGRTKLVLMDNNILAAGNYAVEQLEKIIHRGYAVDFNQALDARLVDDHFALLLANVRWHNHGCIRFGCDTHKQIAYCEEAMSKINAYGFKGHYFLYTMLNDDFKECYERVYYWWQRHHKNRGGAVARHLPIRPTLPRPKQPFPSRAAMAKRHGSMGEQASNIPNDRLQKFLPKKRLPMQRVFQDLREWFSAGNGFAVATKVKT